MNINKTTIVDLKPFLPTKLKLNEADPQNPSIPGFSKTTTGIFYNMHPENIQIRTLNDSNCLVEHEIKTLDQLAKTLKSTEKHENRDKILAVLGVAAAVAICVAGFVGIGLTVAFPGALLFLIPLICFPTGCAALVFSGLGASYAFNALPEAKKNLSDQMDRNAHVFTDYQIHLQQFLIDHEVTLKAALKEAIQEQQRELDDWVGFQALREAKESFIADLNLAMQQLNELVAFYSEEDNNSITLTA